MIYPLALKYVIEYVEIKERTFFGNFLVVVLIIGIKLMESVIFSHRQFNSVKIC